MTRNEYLKSVFDNFNKGEIGAEAYDAALMNIDAFCDDDEEDED